MQKSDYLRALLTPASVALVGASGKPGSMGRIVLENLLGGGFEGALHRRQSQASPRARAALVPVAARDREAGRPRADRDAGGGGDGVLDDAARAGVKAAVILSAPPPDAAEAQRWQASLRAVASTRRHPGARTAFVRRDPHRHRTQRDARQRGRALAAGSRSSRSRARCARRCSISRRRSASAFRRWWRWAARSTSASASCWTRWSSTRTPTASCSTPKRSATRGASCRRCARRRGPSRSSCCGRGGRWSARPIDAPSPDAVFDAAMKRAGTVRVKTYTQLFAAARILAMHRISRGDRLAIVTNGHGPGTLAADSAADRGIALAELSPATQKALDGVLPPQWRVPQSDRRARRCAAASDGGRRRSGARRCDVDAVLALHVPRPVDRRHRCGARGRRRSRARSTKPVLAAWLGAIDRREADAARSRRAASPTSTRRRTRSKRSRSSRRIATIRSGCSRCRRRNPSRRRPISRAVERLRTDAASARRTVLTRWRRTRCSSTFSLPVAAGGVGRHAGRSDRRGATPGYPVTLRSAARIRAAIQRRSRARSRCATAGC